MKEGWLTVTRVWCIESREGIQITPALDCFPHASAMLRTRTAALSKALARSYATSPSPHALVFLEHRDGELDSASLSALTAASRLGGKVTGFLTGAPDQVPGVLDKAKKHVCPRQSHKTY